MTIQDIAPAIRGLTYNGRRGAYVVFSEEELSASGALVKISPDSDNTDGLITALKAGFDGFEGGPDGTLPGAVVVAGIGTFFLSDEYDNANSAAESGKPHAFTMPAEDPMERNSVVKDKICMVTGGAQGFGEEIVRALVDAGAFAVIADLNIQGARELAEELNSKAGRSVAMAAEVNVSDETSVKELFDTIVVECGGIDLAVSNAGVLKAGSVKELTLKDFRFVTDVNYIGYFLITKYASPVMAQQNRAVGSYFADIVQINSKSGLEGSNKNGAYAGGKFGGIGLTQSFALELVEDNIKVNSICPGNFFDGPLWSDPDRGLFVQYLNAGKVPGAKTVADVKRFYEEKVPMKRGCEGRDVVRAILYVIEQRYETGQAVPVTGGQVMLK